MKILEVLNDFQHCVAVEQTLQNLQPDCIHWQLSAEKELRAFLAAVGELHGERASQLAAGYWLNHLSLLKVPLCFSIPESLWRTVSIAAAAQLANEGNSF